MLWCRRVRIVEESDSYLPPFYQNGISVSSTFDHLYHEKMEGIRKRPLGGRMALFATLILGKSIVKNANDFLG
jgi:hypothetical protein